jgi:mannose-6-phosphate isomerase-like protein (cupin superfamily)
VIDGTGLLASGDSPGTPVQRDTAVWLPPGARYRLTAGAGGLTMDSVTLPAATGALGATGVPRLARLEDCAAEVTGDRRFRVLFGPGNGCAAATQFVGEIPPGRAPLHSHTYDEVVLVLSGEGVLHAGPAGHPIASGSCIHLPPGQQHCLENTGRDTLRVLGVFHPGGSPAAKTTSA